MFIIHQPLSENHTQDLELPTEKTELQKTAFDRIIISIDDFIIFLQDLYLPTDAILVPPEGGWPDITKETWSSFGKSDEVIEVLRHLTYVKPYRTSDPYEFITGGGLYDFRNPNRVKEATRGDGRFIAFMTEIPDRPAPPYVVGIVRGSGSCPVRLLDCRNGLVYGEGTHEGGWSEGVRRPVEDYFALLKERFRNMQLLPQGRYNVSEEGNSFETIRRPLKEIYKRHGWPDNYRRDECVAEVAEFGKASNIVRLQDEYLRSLTPRVG
ncbi:hypothetical protein OHC33_009948 [Knufia fluminis]|uniref:Uncharacterized protein n=1 Tax=Knufia fluminis TaxID=191047 RepID=A0AAN8IIE2_9EURO|nr:hypothetical protein OHC33_009948 [Knufia fluminis]